MGNESVGKCSGGPSNRSATMILDDPWFKEVKGVVDEMKSCKGLAIIDAARKMNELLGLGVDL